LVFWVTGTMRNRFIPVPHLPGFASQFIFHMTSVCLHFKLHQPQRLILPADKNGPLHLRYTDSEHTAAGISRLADNSYLPANKILLEQIRYTRQQLKVNFSISGTMLRLLQQFRPDVLRSFDELLQTGCVEILAETFDHSLSSLYSPAEFHRQVLAHRRLVKELLNIEPVVFRNTELIHSNRIAGMVTEMGLKGILCEGMQKILGGRSPNRLYASAENKIALLLRNPGLSDDIAFRFNDVSWTEHPLTAAKFAQWLHNHPTGDEVINLFLDYATFGIHKPASSGIFEFLQNLPREILANDRFAFYTASEIIDALTPASEYDVPNPISWDDKNKECCVACENVLQNNMLKKIYSLEQMVMKTHDEQIKELWGTLQTADYFYYMSDKRCRTNDHSYLNPFFSPSEAHRNYAAIVTDFELLLIQRAISDYKYSHYDAAAGMLY
jgi:alpha-amylase